MKNIYEVYGDKTIIYMNRKDGTIIETVIDTYTLSKANEFAGKWYPHWNPHTNSFYVYGMKKQITGEKRNAERLHRWLLDNPENLVVDHINHDSLDNRISNLRAVTNAENIRNRKSLQSNNKSGVNGVYWYKSRNKWHASFRFNNQRIFVGYYATKEEAELNLTLKQAEIEGSNTSFLKNSSYEKGE